jgi:hypothetical protein
MSPIPTISSFLSLPRVSLFSHPDWCTHNLRISPLFFQALLGELDSAAKFSYFNQEGSSGVTAYKKENHSARPSLKQAMSQSPPR